MVIFDRIDEKKTMKFLKEYVILWVDYLILLAFIFVCRPGDEVILDQSVYRTFSVSHQMVLSEYIMLIRCVCLKHKYEHKS